MSGKKRKPYKQKKILQDAKIQKAQEPLLPIDLMESKIIYLKYFPVHKDSKDLLRKTEPEKIDEDKACIYCGNVHVREYNQDKFFICEECRKKFVEDQQEFLEIAVQTKENLEALLDISFEQSPAIKNSMVWFQRVRNYFLDDGDKKDKFGFRRDWISVDITDNQIIFSICGGLPQTYFMFICSVYYFEIFFNSTHTSAMNMMIRLWNCIERSGLMKWYGLHFMYLNGYANFCEWQDRRELRGNNYKEWRTILGSPMSKNTIGKEIVSNELTKKRKWK